MTTATPWKTSIKKMNLYFTYESRDTLESLSWFLFVKTVSKLNMEHSFKLEIEIWKN